jgi:protein CpxP
MNNRRIALLIVFFTGMLGFARAQTPDSLPEYSAAKQASPQKRSAHQLVVLQKQLDLTRDQVMQVRILLLNQAISLDSLKTNPSGNKKSDRYDHRRIVQGTDQQIKALLSDDQKKRYDAWKEEQKEKGKKNAPPKA